MDEVKESVRYSASYVDEALTRLLSIDAREVKDDKVKLKIAVSILELKNVRMRLENIKWK